MNNYKIKVIEEDETKNEYLVSTKEELEDFINDIRTNILDGWWEKIKIVKLVEKI